MYIHTYRTTVYNGYKGNYQIFNSTTEEDIEAIKKEYSEQIKSSSAYTLHKK